MNLIADVAFLVVVFCLVVWPLATFIWDMLGFAAHTVTKPRGGDEAWRDN